MKTRNILYKAAFFLLLTAGVLPQVQAQQVSTSTISKEALLERSILARQYTFHAQSAMPLGGRLIQLTTPYELTIKGDSLEVFLPYFGRAFVAPMDPTKSGIQFTSTDFEYTIKEAKRGWNITITPNDVRDVRQLFLQVSESGMANLQVTSNNRQPISFNGRVHVPTERE